MPIHEHYGSTESTNISWVGTTRDPSFDGLRLPAGKDADGGEALLLDEDGNPCAPGEPGELVIRSRHNALGEWVDGALVTDRLRRDPLDPGITFYPTGDIARLVQGGVIVILGRADRLIKLNGQRVELAEVEAALRVLPGVNDAAVVVQDRSAARTLIAWVEPKADGTGLTGDALRSASRGMLPAHMIPARSNTIPSLPRLPTEKVDLVGLAKMANPPPGA